MSDPATSSWQARSGWYGSAKAGRFGREGGVGVRLDVIERQALATIIAQSGEEVALGRLIQARFGLALPDPGRAAFGVAGGLVWSSPGQWLVVGAAGSSLADLPHRLAGVAAVTDQSDGRALVRISGPDARTTLAKGVSIDLHPSVFTAGSAAVTSVAHIGVQLWQVDDMPIFMLAVPRGFAGSFWSWLISAAAEYGYEVTQVAS